MLPNLPAEINNNARNIFFVLRNRRTSSSFRRRLFRGRRGRLCFGNHGVLPIRESAANPGFLQGGCDVEFSKKKKADRFSRPVACRGESPESRSVSSLAREASTFSPGETSRVRDDESRSDFSPPYLPFSLSLPNTIPFSSALLQITDGR